MAVGTVERGVHVGHGAGGRAAQDGVLGLLELVRRRARPNGSSFGTGLVDRQRDRASAARSSAASARRRRRRLGGRSGERARRGRLRLRGLAHRGRWRRRRLLRRAGGTCCPTSRCAAVGRTQSDVPPCSRSLNSFRQASSTDSGSARYCSYISSTSHSLAPKPDIAWSCEDVDTVFGFRLFRPGRRMVGSSQASPRPPCRAAWDAELACVVATVQSCRSHGPVNEPRCCAAWSLESRDPIAHPGRDAVLSVVGDVCGPGHRGIASVAAACTGDDKDRRTPPSRPAPSRRPSLTQPEPSSRSWCARSKRRRAGRSRPDHERPSPSPIQPGSTAPSSTATTRDDSYDAGLELLDAGRGRRWPRRDREHDDERGARQRRRRRGRRRAAAPTSTSSQQRHAGGATARVRLRLTEEKATGELVRSPLNGAVYLTRTPSGLEDLRLRPEPDGGAVHERCMRLTARATSVRRLLDLRRCCWPCSASPCPTPAIRRRGSAWSRSTACTASTRPTTSPGSWRSARTPGRASRCWAAGPTRSSWSASTPRPATPSRSASRATPTSTSPGTARDKINAAMVYGGPQAMADAVAGYVGITPDYVFTTSFSGLTRMVRGIGGVRAKVTYPMDDLEQVFRPGMHDVHRRRGAGVRPDPARAAPAATSTGRWTRGSCSRAAWPR